MKVFIKNMVCARCKKAVASVFAELGIEVESMELGEVELAHPLTSQQKEALQSALGREGFALLDDRTSQVIDQIKTVIIQWVHHSTEKPNENFSALISKTIHQEYSALSRLFSETEGITIEQYLIQQRVERAKELMVYDEQSLSQIAFDMGYSSTAHLSAQFKKVTGMTPTYFKSLQSKGRKPLDEVGKAK